MNLRIFFVVLLGLAFSAHAADRKTIVFIGDSLTAGYGLENPSTQAYLALIQKKIDLAQLPYRIVNVGLSANTTAGGLRRINWLLR